MLEKIEYNEDGKARFLISEVLAMSVINADRRKKVDQIFLGEERPIPEGYVEVAFVHPDRPVHYPEYKVDEWADHQKDKEYAGTWTLYHVTEQQVLDYVNSLGEVTEMHDLEAGE